MRITCVFLSLFSMTVVGQGITLIRKHVSTLKQSFCQQVPPVFKRSFRQARGILPARPAYGGFCYDHNYSVSQSIAVLFIMSIV